MKDRYVGFCAGVVVTIFVWGIAALLVEARKIDSGYLIHQDQVYRVEYVGESPDMSDAFEQAIREMLRRDGEQ